MVSGIRSSGRGRGLPAGARRRALPSWEALFAQLLWRTRIALDGPKAAHPTPR